MERKLTPFIVKDLEKKMVFLAGPRQVGKTYLAKSLSSKWPDLFYLNFDLDEDKKIFLKKQWSRSSQLVVMDEVHKWPKWKPLLKGVYDTEGIPPRLMVTGSARLNMYRRGGDSLAGRYFLYHLYPLTLSDLKEKFSLEEGLERLMLYGGFPEPFLSADQTEAARWRKSMIDRVVREDIQDLEPISKIQSMLILIELLRERVGSAISYSSIAEDLHVSPHTVKHWIDILENMYLVFKVAPYSKNIARAVTKEPKIYFYDTGMVRGNEGAVFENLVALSIKKHLHFLQDTRGEDNSLCYLRDREKREVDFVIAVNGKANLFVEAKLSDSNLSTSLKYYAGKFPSVGALQVVAKIDRGLNVDGISIEPASSWLSQLE